MQEEGEKTLQLLFQEEFQMFHFDELEDALQNNAYEW